MLLIVTAMLVILALAALVLVYAAFPHRGETVPGAPWLGDAMERAADAAPLLEFDERDDVGILHQRHRRMLRHHVAVYRAAA